MKIHYQCSNCGKRFQTSPIKRLTEHKAQINLFDIGLERK